MRILNPTSRVRQNLRSRQFPARMHEFADRKDTAIHSSDKICLLILTFMEYIYEYLLLFLPLLNLPRGTCLLLLSTLLISFANHWLAASTDAYFAILSKVLSSKMLCSRSIINRVSANPHLYGIHM